jgi:tetratricopeptide (TPR) repeat protein
MDDDYEDPEELEDDLVTLERMVAVQPRDADAWVALAEFAWERKAYGEALDALAEATRVTTDREQAVTCLLTRGDLLALAFSRVADGHHLAALKLSPRSVPAWARVSLRTLVRGDSTLPELLPADAAQGEYQRLLRLVVVGLVELREAWDLLAFTRTLLARMDEGGVRRLPDLGRFLAAVHEGPQRDAPPGDPPVAFAARRAFEHLVELVPGFWGGAAGESSVLFPRRLAGQLPQGMLVVPRAVCVDET